MNIEEIMRMTPQQKARKAAQAVKFCLGHKLLRPVEVKVMQEKRPGAAAEIGLRSIIRMEAYLKTRPGERKELRMLNGGAEAPAWNQAASDGDGAADASEESRNGYKRGDKVVCTQIGCAGIY